MANQIQMWETADNKVFFSEEDANNHEKATKAVDKLLSIADFDRRGMSKYDMMTWIISSAKFIHAVLGEYLGVEK